MDEKEKINLNEETVEMDEIESNNDVAETEIADTENSLKNTDVLNTCETETDDTVLEENEEKQVSEKKPKKVHKLFSKIIIIVIIVATLIASAAVVYSHAEKVEKEKQIKITETFGGLYNTVFDTKKFDTVAKVVKDDTNEQIEVDKTKVINEMQNYRYKKCSENEVMGKASTAYDLFDAKNAIVYTCLVSNDKSSVIVIDGEFKVSYYKLTPLDKAVLTK